MTDRDVDLCGVRWCDEIEGHDGPHRTTLYDTFGLDVQTGRPVVVQVNRQGLSARVTALVLITGMCETGLTWPQASELGHLMSDQARMRGNTSR